VTTERVVKAVNGVEVGAIPQTTRSPQYASLAPVLRSLEVVF
jgi:hypothetical protein